eukprot:scaffold3236_cov66-Cylindrotheca_fusiformis.AAC.3
MSTNNTTESPNEDATKSSSSSSYSVIILGDAFADLYCFLEGDLPKEAGGDTRLKHPIRTVAGGSGLNTATHLKSLDANNTTTTTTTNKKNVCLYTALNDTDPYGILLHQHADQYGFSLYNCCSVKSDESSTGHCAVLVANGDRSFLTHLGVMEQFDAQEHIPVDVICETTTTKTSSLHVHVSGYYNIAGFWNGKLKQTIQQIQEKHKATKTKVVTSLLCQYDATEQWDGGLLDLLPLIDYLFVNEIEATKIARSNGSQVSSPPIASTNKNDDDTTEEDVFLKSMATFFDSVSPGTCVILTLGARGACALKGGTIVAQQSAPMTLQNPLDPTGAGDAFIAGFLHGIVALAKEQEEEEDSNACIRRGLLYGCVVGTSCVMRSGASNPTPLDEIDAMISKVTTTKGAL